MAKWVIQCPVCGAKWKTSGAMFAAVTRSVWTTITHCHQCLPRFWTYHNGVLIWNCPCGADFDSLARLMGHLDHQDEEEHLTLMRLALLADT